MANIVHLGSLCVGHVCERECMEVKDATARNVRGPQGNYER